MSPLFYLVIGLIGGALIVAVVVLLRRRGNQSAATELAKRLDEVRAIFVRSALDRLLS